MRSRLSPRRWLYMLPGPLHSPMKLGCIAGTIPRSLMRSICWLLSISQCSILCLWSFRGSRLSVSWMPSITCSMARSPMAWVATWKPWLWAVLVFSVMASGFSRSRPLVVGSSS